MATQQTTTAPMASPRQPLKQLPAGYQTLLIISLVFVCIGALVAGIVALLWGTIFTIGGTAVTSNKSAYNTIASVVVAIPAIEAVFSLVLLILISIELSRKDGKLFVVINVFLWLSINFLYWLFAILMLAIGIPGLREMRREVTRQD